MVRYITKKKTKKSKRWSERLNGPKPNPIRRPKKMRYNEDALASAVEQCQAGMSRKKAEKIFSVPASTITDRINLTHTKPVGRPTAIEPEIETLLVAALQSLASWGFGLNRMHVLSIAHDYLESIGRNHIKLGRKWFYSFLKRHRDQLALRKASNMPSNRGRSITNECLDDFFELLNEHYDRLNLHLKPHSIWNVDESGFNCDQGTCRIVCRKGEYNPNKLQGKAK